MKKIIVVLVILISVTNSYGQKSITGTVTTELGNPLQGVSVLVNNTEAETITDEYGKYEINVPSGYKTVTFEKTGYQLEEVDIKGLIVDVVMKVAETDLFDLNLEELMEIEIVSASNTKEKLSEAPATVVVVTKADIIERGYLSIDEVFDDLPGMQVARSYGADTYYRNYWRGYRNSFGEPYLIMVDGLIKNEIFYGSPEFINGIPISNVERIEVVYGPVSSVYGANAFMGVINVITRKDLAEDGTKISVQTSNNFGDAIVSDLHAFAKKGDFRFSFAGKIQKLDFDDFIDGESYEYQKDKYQKDRRIWGGSLNSAEYGGTTDLPRATQSASLSLFYKDFEVGVQLNHKDGAWGHEYPTDKALASIPHKSKYFRGFMRYHQKFGDKVFGNFLMSYHDNFDDNEDWIEAYNLTNLGTANMILGGDYVLAPGQTTIVTDHSTWTHYSYSYLIQQDFDINVTKNIEFNTGLRYEQKKFANQRGNYGKAYFPDSLKSPVDDGFIADRTTETEMKSFLHVQNEYGAYVQSRYKFLENHHLNLGVRFDHNSVYGSNTTIRAGYVGTFDRFTGKLLYGEAYQAPIPRTLYGGWSPQGSSLDLVPEESQTFEMSLNYTQKGLSSTISVYHVINTNTIVQFSGGATNAGERKITGVDFHLRGQIEPTFMNKIKGWLYYSLILNEEEKKFDSNDNDIGTDIIGDLSYNNLSAGVTGIVNDYLTLNLIGRYVGERQTVSTNPIDKIDPYFTLNGNLVLSDLFIKGFGLQLKVNNILDQQYFHPGVKNADAGEIPAYWEGDKLVGSTGWFSSKLPQPHRYFMVTLTFDM